MKTSPFLLHICSVLETKLGTPVTVLEASPEFGGSINESFSLNTSQGIFFLKRNKAGSFPDMFIREAEGLQLLRIYSEFKIPQVIAYGTDGDFDYLVMEHIPKQNAGSGFWQTFGRKLAQLHKQTHLHFGLEQNNYIGSIPQSNSFKSSWTDFFVSERIVPLVSKAHESGKLDIDTVKKFEKLCFRIPDLFPAELPALLHGDLWSGNYMCAADGVPCIFDPAVYYGHREMDLAMMQLFGGFHVDTYKAYNEVYPLDPDWKKRTDLCNLYPLLVHVNLFGGTYVKQVKTILQNYA